MKHGLICSLCLFLLIACSKNDTSTPPAPTVDAKGIWSVQKTIQTQNGSSVQYNTAHHACLGDNKYELKTGTSKFYFAGTDSCYLYKNGSTYILAGVPGTQSDFTWQQTKDTVIMTYTNRFKDTGILNALGGKNYLTLVNHNGTYTYTVICIQ